MNWEKIGLIFQPTKTWWNLTHAMIPTPHQIDGCRYRIYYSGRDEKNVSHIGFFEIDLNEPKKILTTSKKPVLSPGSRGCFDDNGVTPSSVVNVGIETYLYYIGWNPGFNVRMHLFGGLAIMKDNEEVFHRFSEAPIIERNKINPYLNTAPFVLKTDSKWIMYYVSGVQWLEKNLPQYNIQIATSLDGKNWIRDGKVAIDFKDKFETALARPWVLYDKNIYKMWFSFKSGIKKNDKYKLGYAESEDGITWRRIDSEVGITMSKTGWDSEMIEYASVIKYENEYFMFYNGNKYGYDGIGLAIAKNVN